MTKTWAITTNKGGVLKTSLVSNLAGVFSQRGKILIVDGDNQGNIPLSFWKNPDEIENTLYDCMVDGVDPNEVIINIHDNIDLLPSNDDLSFLEYDVLTNRDRYTEPFKLLTNVMKKIDTTEYEYILFDSPPNLGLMVGNILSYVEKILIPFQPESYSMRSLIKILQAVAEFKNQHNPKLEVLGVIGTLVDQRTTLHTEVLQKCRKYCAENNIPMFDTVIPRSVRFAASVAYDGLPATLTNKKNTLVSSYFDLVKEVDGIGTKK